MISKKPRQIKYKLSVRRGTHGLGLFAEDAIRKGEFVIEYHGRLLTDAQADVKGGKYLFAMDNGWTIDGTPRRNKARYINHSCRPNCEPEIRGRRVFIHARRRIKPGEELAYDYCTEYWK